MSPTIDSAMSSANIIPALRYKDAPAAIDWLCDVLGFKKHVVFESDGVVHHAELTFGNGMIMLGSSREGPFDELTQIPIEVDNYNTQSPYIFVDNLIDHYNNVKSKGAEIVLPLKKEPHGSGYTCRDPEGYIWSFGDMNPWNNKSNV